MPQTCSFKQETGDTGCQFEDYLIVNVQHLSCFPVRETRPWTTQTWDVRRGRGAAPDKMGVCISVQALGCGHVMWCEDIGCASWGCGTGCAPLTLNSTTKFTSAHQQVPLGCSLSAHRAAQCIAYGKTQESFGGTLVQSFLYRDPKRNARLCSELRACKYEVLPCFEHITLARCPFFFYAVESQLWLYLHQTLWNSSVSEEDIWIPGSCVRVWLVTFGGSLGGITVVWLNDCGLEKWRLGILHCAVGFLTFLCLGSLI